MAKMMKCVSPYSVDIEGVPTTVHEGDIVPDDAEVYRRAPGAYVEAKDSVRPDIEEMTAAPGEKRGGRTQQRG